MRTGGIPWAAVRKYAEAGAPEDDIARALGIAKATLDDPDTGAKFRDVVERGHAFKRLLLREAIDQRGRRSSRRAGSVNALALEARNMLGWDQHVATPEAPPDYSTAHKRLELTLTRLAAAKSEMLGWKVDPAHLLICDVYGLDVDRLKGVSDAELIAFVTGKGGNVH